VNLPIVERNSPLQGLNSFGISAVAQALMRVRSPADVQALLADPAWAAREKFILGGGCNIVLTGDVQALVLKTEIMGKHLLAETDKHWLVEAGAGENWHDFVAWTLAQGWPGLENLALIPGSVGAAPVQNIGAYGVELQDRFHSLDAVHLITGEEFTLDAAQCGFSYRDSVFKHSDRMGLAGKALITRVRFALPKKWQPVLGYADFERQLAHTPLAQGSAAHQAQQIFDMVVAIRRAKLPDPGVIGNAGSFFKNPTVTAEQCEDIIAREPKLVHYPMLDGSVKLAAGWLIDACGWKGKSMGRAAVYEKQALVLVNRGGKANPCTGGEVMTLAGAIQTSVYERFGIRLEPEPVFV
jgi:UDP-N-acetylmuramate dehydrogenase